MGICYDRSGEIPPREIVGLIAVEIAVDVIVWDVSFWVESWATTA